jgi:hypothetical protein
MLRSTAARAFAGVLLLAICRSAAGSGLALDGPAGVERLSVETETGYTKAQTFNAALRYLRVDLAYEVTEKDANAAYLLFRFVPPGRKTTTNGAFEIVEQRDGVRVSVRLPELPRYHEQLLSDGLLQKLRDEYGEPPPHREPPPPPRNGRDAPDGG